MENRVLGQKIGTLRRERKLTSDKLAGLCGVYPGHIRQIESGVRLPSLKLLIDICNVLQVSPEYLLSQELKDVEKDEDADNVYRNVLAKIKKLTPNELEMLDSFLDTYLCKLESVKRLT